MNKSQIALKTTAAAHITRAASAATCTHIILALWPSGSAFHSQAAKQTLELAEKEFEQSAQAI